MDTRFSRLGVPAAVLGAAALALALGAGPAGAAPAGAVEIDVAHRTLLVRGGEDADTLALRALDPWTVGVDVGDDGAIERVVKRHRFGSILVLAGGGDDRVRVDGVREPVLELGGDGADELVLEGSAAAERFELERRGDRARVSRDPGRGRIDLDDVERVATRAQGGADAFTAGDLSGTDVNDVNLDLGADGAGDRVVSLGSDAAEFASVFTFGADTYVLGMPTFLQVVGAEATDRLALATLGGDDRVDASGTPQVTVDGGAGDDVLAGGAGAETLLGRAGADFADGNGGDDRADLGPGDDILRWDPGDGSDDVEGRAGHDVLLFLGSSGPETFDVAADGGRVRFLRDVGAIAMDLGGIEKIDTIAGAGADTMRVGDLSRTDLELVETNLSGVAGLPAPDGATDRLLVEGTARDDAVAVAGAAGTLDVTGLPARVRATRAEALDRLEIDGGAGADTLDDSGLAAGVIGLEFRD